MTDWEKLLANSGIRIQVRRDPLLAQVLGQALSGIQGYLSRLGLPYRLDAQLTRGGEYLIRMRVAYRSQEERDRIWDRAAAILEQARAGRQVHILCGISRLTSVN